MTKAEKEKERQEALARLRDMVKPGDTIYTILRHRSASGMSRIIDCKVVVKNEHGTPQIMHIGYNVAKALGYTWVGDKDGMRVGGCGMDMGFHVVYSLARQLYADTFYCVGDGGKDWRKRCQSNDHFNGDKQGYKVGHKHSDGGYSINQSWL